MSLLSARGDEEVMAEINITPFTDVLLVLLIIFMILAALSAPPGFEKQLANHSNNVSQQQKHDDIQVTVNKEGEIYVDTTKTDVRGIYSVMYQVSKVKPGKHVSITADAKAPYGIIIRILDAAKDANLTDVGFVSG